MAAKNSMQTQPQVWSAGRPTGASKLAVTGGVLSALAATSCCVLPLALTLLGVSGAWMANLRALAPYQPFLIALAVASLGYGFYQVYWKREKACAAGEECAAPLPGRLVKLGLWIGAVIVSIVVTFGLWFPIIMPYLP